MGVCWSTPPIWSAWCARGGPVPSDALAVLDAIPAEHIPAAVMRLSARLMTPAATQADDLQIQM